MTVQARRSIQTRLFIGGKFVDAADGATIAVLNPHDNSTIADVAEAKAADIDRAVEAAQKAFPKWAALGAAERGRLLLKLADKIEEKAEELAWLESIDTGHPIRDTRGLDVPRTAVTFRYFGGMADKLEGSVVPVEPGFLNYVLREPLGVVGQVVPWNFPLMFCSWKMGPALAAGTVLACMEALADFGTVSTFGFRTLTEAIYRVWHGMFDRLAATQLAVILLALAGGLVALERLSRGRARFTHGRRPARSSIASPRVCSCRRRCSTPASPFCTWS